MTQPLTAAGQRAPLVLFAALGVAVLSLVWAWWTTLVEVARLWSIDPQYSHGYLVPFFAVALLWFRRDLCPHGPLQPTWWGALVLAAGLGLRIAGTYYFFVWPSIVSLIPTLAGLVLMIGGWAAWRWAWPSVVFLIFMLPLPYSFASWLTGPLQAFATVVCTFLLQTMGIPAIAEGNVILLSEVEIGIVEACSGLRMLVIFFALSTAVALLVKRPLWDKAVIVLSAFPIALIANIIRITATGVLHETVGSRIANAVFHDLAGWLMMPLALGLLGLELGLLSRLFLEGPAPIRRRPTAPRTMRSQPRAALRPRPAA